MATVKEVYRCAICGNIVEVLHGGAGELVCCGEPMQLLVPKTKVAEGKEKHVPLVEKTAGGFRVQVGSTPHPMEEKHYIEWIALTTDEQTCRKFLRPGVKPEAQLCVTGGKLIARAYCNVHGLWEG